MIVVLAIVVAFVVVFAIIVEMIVVSRLRDYVRCRHCEAVVPSHFAARVNESRQGYCEYVEWLCFVCLGSADDYPKRSKGLPLKVQCAYGCNREIYKSRTKDGSKGPICLECYRREIGG